MVVSGRRAGIAAGFNEKRHEAACWHNGNVLYGFLFVFLFGFVFCGGIHLFHAEVLMGDRFTPGTDAAEWQRHAAVTSVSGEAQGAGEMVQSGRP